MVQVQVHGALALVQVHGAWGTWVVRVWKIVQGFYLANASFDTESLFLLRTLVLQRVLHYPCATKLTPDVHCNSDQHTMLPHLNASSISELMPIIC